MGQWMASSYAACGITRDRVAIQSNSVWLEQRDVLRTGMAAVREPNGGPPKANDIHQTRPHEGVNCWTMWRMHHSRRFTLAMSFGMLPMSRGNLAN